MSGYPQPAPGWGQQQNYSPQQSPYQGAPQYDPSVSSRGLAVVGGDIRSQGHSGSTHSYSHEELRAFVEFINERLNDDADLATDLPINPNSEQLFEVVGKGIVDLKKLAKARSGVASVFQINQNLQIGIQACRELGVVVVNIGPEDLREGKPHLVLGLIWQCVKIALLSAVNLDQHPELVVLLEENEDITRFMNVAPEVNLLRWFNFHLRRAQHPRTVNNFSSDIQDAENYLVLLSQIAPHIVPRDAHQEPDPTARANLVAHYAEQLGCGKMITAADILSVLSNFLLQSLNLQGNDKLNLVFTAYLFNKFPGLELLEDNAKQKQDLEEAERLLKLKFEEEEKARQLRWEQEEEERRLAWMREEEERKLRIQVEEEERRRNFEAEAAALASQRSEEEARFAAERAKAEEDRLRREAAEQEAQRKLEEDRRRLEAQMEAARRAEEERKRQFEAEQRLAAARLAEQEAKLEAEKRKLEEEARRRAFEEEQRRLEEEQRKRDEEEEKRRQGAWAAYMEQQRLEEERKIREAADAQEAERLRAWADYNRKQAEEEERRRREAELRRQAEEAAAVAAAEEERRRQEAWRKYHEEQERQRMAAEQERMRQMAMAQEAERQRMMAMAAEQERQRQAAMAAEAERRRQAAMAEQQRLMTIQQQQQQQYLMTQQAMMQQTVVQQYQPPPQPQVQQVTTETRVQKFPIPRLVITAVRARRLAKTETLGKSDPYVVAVHNGRRQKSSHMKGTQEPYWQHDFELYSPDSPPAMPNSQFFSSNVRENDTINISVWDKETLRKDVFMGEVNVLKSDFVNNKESWFQLQTREYRNDRVHGDVQLMFRLYY